MAKIRSKLKSKPKGKRWAKGQSSSSNPQIHKYRELAKSRFFQDNLGPSNLTMAALKKHDVNASQMQIDAGVESLSGSIDNLTVSARSSSTFASDWSECSNTSFSKLMRIFRSDSALHKEMLAVLAAVTEIIKANGGDESSTEYYAAFMTTLESAETEESVAAILSLLAMGLKTVPTPVLRIQFSKASKLFLNVLDTYKQTENNVIFKSIFSCLGIFLCALESIAWKNIDVLHAFDSILAFVTYSKPKIRKSAQKSVLIVLTKSCFIVAADENSTSKIDKHPCAAHVSQFCRKQIEENVRETGGQTTTLHVLTFLKDILKTFPQNQIKQTCETILKVMTLNNPLITSCSLQVFHELFSQQKVTIAANTNLQLIAALYEYQPSMNDVQLSLAWITVMQSAHVHLADADAMLCMTALRKIFENLIKMWLSDRSEIVNGVLHALEAIVKDCLGTVVADPSKLKQARPVLVDVFEMIESCLSYQYHSSWNQILHLIATVFETTGTSCNDLLKGLLLKLSALRDSHKFSFNNQLEYAVGAAVRYMGVEIVLEVIPLVVNGQVSLDRSWLLPVLKENIKFGSLKYFATNILPLSAACNQKAIEFKNQEQMSGYHTMDLMTSQLWSLLPSFCLNATDTAENFKSIAKTLGTVLTQRKDLRMSVMSALRRLIQHAPNEDDRNEIARFAKNYLPILFQIYAEKPNGTDEEGIRLAAFETIKCYLTIAPQSLLTELYEKSLKLMSDASDDFSRNSIFDLIRAMSVYQNLETLNALYKDVIVKFTTNKTGQKKAYRLLEDICANDTNPDCKEFVKSNRKGIQKFLMNSLAKTANNSKGARLRCLILIIRSTKRINGESKLIQMAIAEAISCSKDVNERCRVASQTLLISIGERMIESNQTEMYLATVMSGFAGDQQMIVNTMLALAAVVYKFKNLLGLDNIQESFNTASKLMKTPVREVVQACLAFYKVFVSAFPVPFVAQSLPTIVLSISNLTVDCQKHFRVRIGHLLQRLIKKFTYEYILKLLPEKDTVLQKRLRNINKSEARKKRRNENRTDDGDSDNEDDGLSISVPKHKSIEEILADSSDEDENADDAPKKKTKNISSWIQDNEEEIVDFMDTSAFAKIRAQKPTDKKPNVEPKMKSDLKKNRGFKQASDGRLLIMDDSSDDENNKKSQKKNKIKLNQDSDDSDFDDVKSTTNTMKSKVSSVSNYSMKSGASSASKYKPGGSGIHRKISKHLKDGQEYKAKKAKGDVKKKDKQDPYAYVPLSRKRLGKRKQAQVPNQFKNLVKGGRRVKAGRISKAEKNKKL